MIPNCQGCEQEIAECYDAQQKGYDAGLEGMGERKHCLFFVLDKRGRFIVPIYAGEEK